MVLGPPDLHSPAPTVTGDIDNFGVGQNGDAQIKRGPEQTTDQCISHDQSRAPSVPQPIDCIAADKTYCMDQ